MTSNGVAPVRGEGQPKEGAVVLRDLRGLLLKSIGKDVAVLESATSMLLPKGENYASTMLRVEALIRRSRDSPAEKLHLVAKMIPESEYQRSLFDSTVMFAKEIYFMETVAEVYKRLEREAGVREDKVIDVFPKIYGGRLSRTPGKLVADEDAVMLLENLKVRGYDTMDRKKGLDFDHALVAIGQLARYHALGMALRLKEPQLFEEVRKVVDHFPVRMEDLDQFDDLIGTTIDTVATDERLRELQPRVRKNLVDQKGYQGLINIELIEPWITINHGDFWVNNVMFQHDDKDNIKDVKFVDFQIARVCNPLRDLPYFLCTSTSFEVMENCFEELLDAYQAKLVEELDQLGVDSSPVTRKSFDEALLRAGEQAFFQCLTAAKFFTLEVEQDLDLNDMKNQVMLAKPSDLYTQRIYMIVRKFAEKGWI